MCCGLLLYMFMGVDVGEVGTGLLWCDFQVLHNLCHHLMVVNNLVCSICVFLMV